MVCCSIAMTFQTGISKCVFSQSIFLFVFPFALCLVKCCKVVCLLGGLMRKTSLLSA